MNKNAYSVRVGKSKNGEFTTLGSGTFVAPNCVLTAKHVYFDRPEGVEVWIDDRKQAVPCDVYEDKDDPSLDIGLLKLKEPIVCASHVHIQHRVLVQRRDVELLGFPVGASMQKLPNLSIVPAMVNRQSIATDDLLGDTTHGPKDWRGLSGGGVFDDGVLIGVIKGGREDWVQGCFRATPVARFYQKPWFHQVLGLPDEAQRGVDDDLANLRVSLVEILSQSSITSKVREELRQPSTTLEALVEALISMPAEDAVFVITCARDGLKPNDEKGRADAREIFLRIMPYATDWREVLREGRSRHALGLLQFEVPCHRQSVAEFILAGIHRRPATFLPLSPGLELRGVGCVYLPSPASAPFRCTPQLLRDAVMEKLSKELGDGYGKLNDAILRYFHDEHRPGIERVDTAKSHLQRMEKFRGRPNYSPPYLVVVDAEFGGGEGGAIAWQMVCDGVGRSLPALHLVRLRGGGGQSVSRDTAVFEGVRDLLTQNGGKHGPR